MGIFEQNHNGLHVPKTEWIVKDAIPKGGTTLWLGRSGTGKSLLTEYLGECSKRGVDFLGFKTEKGDVLIVDEDTPTDSFKRNLNKINTALSKINPNPPNNLYFASMKGLRILDGSLLNAVKEEIKEHPEINLVIFDCLHKILGGEINTNDTTEMSKYARFKNKLKELFPNLTVIVVHHISDKKPYTFAELMDERTYDLSMGSSVITQDADNIIIQDVKTRNKGDLKELGLRVIPKRFRINLGAIIIECVQNEKELSFNFSRFYDPQADLEIVQNIIKLFEIEGRKHKKIRMSVNDVYQKFKDLYGIIKIRETMMMMRNKGILVLCKQKPNIFLFELKSKRKPKENKIVFQKDDQK